MLGDAIPDRLCEEGITLEPAELAELFPPTIRRYLVFHNPQNPLQAAVRLAKNYRALTVTAIADALKKADITLEPAELAELFPPSTRRFLVVHTPQDPLQAAVRLVQNYRALTDEAIANALKKADITLEPAELAELFAGLFPPSTRRFLVVHTPQDPLQAAVRLVQNYRALTDEAIADALKKADITLEPAELAELFAGLFPPSTRRFLVVHTPQDPLQAAVRLVQNYRALTDEAIADALKQADITLEHAEFAELFTPSTRRHLVVGNPQDPLQAAVYYVERKKAGTAVSADVAKPLFLESNGKSAITS